MLDGMQDSGRRSMESNKFSIIHYILVLMKITLSLHQQKQRLLESFNDYKLEIIYFASTGANTSTNCMAHLKHQ